MKRWIALLLCAIMTLSLLAGCGGKDGGEGSADTVEISWWINRGEDSTYYMTYEENPVVRYLESLDYNGKKVDYTFVVPITGKELDNFNTLLMTDEYTDVMDMAISTITPAQLYEDGYIWDLTPYIDEYMPNYKKAMEENPDLEPYMYSMVNGEKKMLSLYSLTGRPIDADWGYTYRRDWIAKYGTNPKTGAAFTYGFTDPADANTWQDDIIFPSGGADPVYISDWEWMFEIFDKAMADLGIDDGYCYSPFFKGYNEVGYLNSSFGGGTAMWSVEDGQVSFDGNNDSMRAYLECMNAWYEKGWLDKAFAEHTSDQFYSVDMTKVHQGKVGMWIGRASEMGNGMDVDDEFTDGIVAVGCRLPINDVYGGAEQQGVEPDSLYQKSKLRGSCVVTKKVTEEELPAVLGILDYLYSRHGGRMIYGGLTGEEAQAINDPCYEKYGLLENGSLTEIDNGDGTYSYARADLLNHNSELRNFYAGKRIFMGYTQAEILDGLVNPLDTYLIKAKTEWDFYTNTGAPESVLRDQFTEDESNAYTKIHANVDTFMATNIPKFIMGDLDVNSDDDWNNYCKMLDKYGPEKITKIYQRLYDELK